jgi:hypothetical protein
MDNPIISVDDLNVYRDHFTVGNVIYSFDSVRRLKGGKSNLTINFVPMVKSSSLSIKLLSGVDFSYEETSTFLNRKRHESLNKAYVFLRSATFNFRTAIFLSELRENGCIKVFDAKAFPADLVEVLDLKDVILYSNGVLESNGLRVDLAVAATQGALWLGTESSSFARANCSYDPGKIVVSEHKPGRKPHEKSIVFDSYPEDFDVTQAVMKSLAEGRALGN